MWGDPDVVRHITGTPSKPQQSWMRVLNYAGHWHLMGFGYWVVEETATGRFAGEVGFADFKRGLAPELAGVPETGWAFATEFHGRGFATEAVRGILDWSERTMPWPRTTCIITPQNVASLAVAQKCGFTEFDRIDNNGDPLILFERPKNARP